MELTLTDNEARMLRAYLRDHFHSMQLEVARTENKNLRHVLVGQEELIERLLRLLDQHVGTMTDQAAAH
jgi:hypothetical protein